MRKGPLRWMPWDCVDWIIGPEIRVMPAACQAGYFNLLCYSWVEDGLKLDRDEIEMVSSLSKKEWRRYGDRILSKFYMAEDGKLRNERQEQERAIASNKLAHDMKRTEAATKARWPVRDVSVTDTVSPPTGQDRTGQDNTSPLPPTPDAVVLVGKDPPDGSPLPFRVEDIPERTKPARVSSMLPVDYEPQKKLLLERYAAVAPKCGYTPEQVAANFEELFTDSRDRPRPIRHVLNYLNELAPFDAGQVVAAMDVYGKIQQTKGEANAPLSYFMTLVRNDAGKYQRKLEKKEIAADVQKSREAQRRAQTQPVDRSSTNAKPKPRHNDFQAVGDVLRALPTVRRACEIEKRDAANAPDEVPE